MAIPVFIKFLPKLLPAAKLAYDHRDKAVTLYKNIQGWRKKEKSNQPLTIDVSEPIPIEQQLENLRTMIAQRDDIITEQSEILAKMATDISELSALTDRLRRRSQWIMRLIYIVAFVALFRWIVS